MQTKLTRRPGTNTVLVWDLYTEDGYGNWAGTYTDPLKAIEVADRSQGYLTIVERAATRDEIREALAA